MAINTETLLALASQVDTTPYSGEWSREITAREYDTLRILLGKLHQANTSSRTTPITHDETESRLRGFGYNNRRETPTNDRRNALRRALNAGMSKDEIIQFLRWLIMRNMDRRNMQSAIERYLDDIQWLEIHS